MKLKKHISALLSVLILFANIGVVLNVHYCHGKVSSVALNYRAEERCGMPKQHHAKKACCAKTEKVTKKSCCKHDVVKIQDNADKAPVKSFQLDLAAFYVSEGYSNTFFGSVAHVAITKDAPAFYAETNAPPLYKLYCQYVFYA